VLGKGAQGERVGRVGAPRRAHHDWRARSRPCPGEIKEWKAEVGDKRVDVHGTHGAQAKCTCAGTGDMVLRGLEPGTYDVHVNGGYNRPIAVRVVVGSP
jgi:hypothetical protein